MGRGLGCGCAAGTTRCGADLLSGATRGLVGLGAWERIGFGMMWKVLWTAV